MASTAVVPVPATSSPSQFLALDEKIQERILRMLLLADQVDCVKTVQGSNPRFDTAILRTCKSIYALGSRIFYEENEFVINIDTMPLFKVSHFLSRPVPDGIYKSPDSPLNRAAQMKHVVFSGAIRKTGDSWKDRQGHGCRRTHRVEILAKELLRVLQMFMLNRRAGMETLGDEGAGTWKNPAELELSFDGWDPETYWCCSRVDMSSHTNNVSEAIKALRHTLTAFDWEAITISNLTLSHLPRGELGLQIFWACRPLKDIADTCQLLGGGNIELHEESNMLLSVGGISQHREPFSRWKDLPPEIQKRILEFALARSPNSIDELDSWPNSRWLVPDHERCTSVRDILLSSKLMFHHCQEILYKKFVFQEDEPELTSSYDRPVLVIHQDLSKSMVPLRRLVKNLRVFDTAYERYYNYRKDKKGRLDDESRREMAMDMSEQMRVLDGLAREHLSLDTLTMEITPYHHEIIKSVLLGLEQRGFLDMSVQSRKELRWTRMPRVRVNTLAGCDYEQNVESVAWVLNLSEPSLTDRILGVSQLVLEVRGEAFHLDGDFPCSHTRSFMHSELKWLIASACKKAFGADMRAVFGGVEGWPQREWLKYKACEWSDPKKEERQRLLDFEIEVTDD